MRKFLLNKELLKKNQVMVMAIIDDSTKELVEYIGEDIPHFITYDEKTNTVREATIKELIDRGDYEVPLGYKYDENTQSIIEMTEEEKKINGIIELASNEKIEDGKVVILSEYEMIKEGRQELREGQYLDDLAKKVITVEYPTDGRIYTWNSLSKEWELNEEATKAKKEAIQNEIIDLEMRKQMYEDKGWDTSTIDSQIAELENQLLTY